ncbi:hypothetical protein SO802_018381 [Lithocarpus litseifolius]|uniref:DUF4283 domain-containing protein n=1 Tax=Lithocarpus litseifolius TaxID=425828 RepID=A0AAW2CMQ0_9ROSI
MTHGFHHVYQLNHSLRCFMKYTIFYMDLMSSCKPRGPRQRGGATTMDIDINLLGKLFTSKAISLNIVKDVVLKAWRLTFPLEVKRLGRDTFMFCFQHEADLQKVFCKWPWSIQGGHLALEKWSAELSWLEVDFSTSTLWVQKSEDNLKKIGLKVGKVIEVDLADGGCDWKKFIRVKVDIDVKSPSLRADNEERPNGIYDYNDDTSTSIRAPPIVSIGITPFTGIDDQTQLDQATSQGQPKYAQKQKPSRSKLFLFQHGVSFQDELM